MAVNKHHLLLLFDRPQEPVFVGKGENRSVFDVSNDYLADRYKPIGVELFNRFGEDASERIPVKKISLPDITEVQTSLGRHENFSLFLPLHQKIAKHLIDVFMGMRNVEEFLSMAVYARDRINPYLFNYCLSVAILHRPDTQDLDIPSIIQTFPDKYVDSKVFTRAREETTIVPEASRSPIEIPKDFTASDLEDEHKIAYWREDLGVNLHHWHWHLVYPFNAAREIVAKNRRGELFYYMHRQIMARYNFERLSNKMKRVERLIDLRAPIPEGYFSKLDSLVASRAWPPRMANQTIKNVNREADQLQVSIDDMYRWRDRIIEAIHKGYLEGQRGERIELTEFEGIDRLGDTIEASILSPNQQYYGNIHNMGHVMLAYIHDPDHRHLESFSIMGDTTTAMRDPVFYRWHSFIDDLFEEHKATLPRYTVARLNFPEVTVQSVSIRSNNSQENILNTFWQQSDVDLSRGMDFQPRGSVFVRFTHLQHQMYNYNIEVMNAGSMKEGMCRIFLAPKFDERGNPWLFRDQKNMFVELDKFRVTLRSGRNTITRSSMDSSITIPFERTFRNLDLNRPTGGDALQQFNFCGCGWPQHMLIPRGSAEGFPCQLFVMISNYRNDAVQQDTSGPCNDAESYCGIKDKLYPDRQSMGFPFDRMPRTGVETLQQFLTPNMRVQDVSIRFTDRVLQRQKAM